AEGAPTMRHYGGARWADVTEVVSIEPVQRSLSDCGSYTAADGTMATVSRHATDLVATAYRVGSREPLAEERFVGEPPRCPDQVRGTIFGRALLGSPRAEEAWAWVEARVSATGPARGIGDASIPATSAR